MRIYKKAPVIEVVAEFYFQPTEWDAVLPGQLYERFKRDFPVKPALTSGIRIGPLGEPQILRPDRIFLASQDENVLIQIGPNILAVNSTKAYLGWNKFFPHVKQIFKAYSEVAQECKLLRLGLQYVNKLALPTTDGRLELKDYLEFYPFTGPNLPLDHGSFHLSVQFFFENAMVLTQLGNVSFTKDKEFNAILDIKAVSKENTITDTTSIYDWMETAHSNVSSVFEGCINDRAREIFEVN